ncbi:MAG: 30S ribosomal protein S17 [Candidatus Daviesbacteria bacterium]|nr:30S ribosomal protein S17 [Candidatus Daviesbacteria bacterium]
MNKIIKQILTGRVVSAKTPQTVVVLIEREKIHPLYKKAFKRSKRFLVHDEIGASLGDLVDIVQVKPMSRNKHFQVQKIVGKNMEAVIIEELKEKAAEAIAEVMPEDRLSVIGSQLSEESRSVARLAEASTKRVSESVTEKQKTGKLKSENRKLITDNRRSK